MAYAGTQVLGHDLSGQGAVPGDYEAQTTESATSPSIDASALSIVELQFQRWLNVANGAIAYVEVKDGGGSWQQVWTSPSFGGHWESSWSAQSLDVSAHAAGNADFQVRFKQVSHIAGSNDAGWNVDQMVLRDGSLPDLAACGGCVGVPSFAGLTAVLDDDPCADSGVTVDWDAAPAWGSGSGGSYAVYRDNVPGFTPGPDNLLASGITVTQWTDPAPPGDVTLYYLVRAENDETCGGGPNNNGLVDGNLVYGEGRNSTSQGAPGEVGPTLRLDSDGGSDMRLVWDAASGAATYRVYRSAEPDGGFALEGETPDLVFDDPGAWIDGQSWYYEVVAVDPCGNEGP
jgi:hypothetical protein